jgi:asparagine synthase (glutamine-hydrolysing)
MGAIDIIIYIKQNIGIDFVKGFMKMKHRGIDNSSYTSESSVNINSLNETHYNRVASILSRAEIANYVQYTFIYGYHHMAITDNSYNATQPFIDPIRNQIRNYSELSTRPIRKLLCNGEIYNYNNLVDTHNFTTKDISSDCDVEVILPLYIKHATSLDNAEQGLIQTISELDGDFAFIITENINTYITSTINTFAVRDFLGVKPLYYVYNSDNTFWMFVSEIKSIPYFIINNYTYKIIPVPPGHFWSLQNIINGGDPFICYHDLSTYKCLKSCTVSETSAERLVEVYDNIKNLLIDSTVKRYLHSLKQVGFLLSGGFDSSILVSIIIHHILENNIDNTIHLFSIGDSLGSDDLDIVYAHSFIDFLETTFPSVKIEHHTIYMNDIEILASDIEKIIYHLETFDPETIRKSIPFYYLFKYISDKTNVKILISGDGLNDLCGHTEYEELCDSEYQRLSVEILQKSHLYDILRTDRVSQAFSLELRHPYLDKSFVEYILSIHPKIKRNQIYKNTDEPIEKYIVRKSFDNSLGGITYLPENIIWRRSSSICCCLTNFELRLTNYFNSIIDDNLYNKRLTSLIETPGVNMSTLPTTKEELYYRNIFETLFPNRSYLVPIFWRNQFSS